MIELKKKVKEIQNECMTGIRSVNNAVEAIDSAIGGITAVLFQDGKRFKIVNHNAMFGLEYDGFGRRQMNTLYGLAAVAYHRAQQNGSRQPGEVHISKKCSTKHHPKGITNLIEKYAA